MLLYMLAIWKGFEWCLQPPVMKKEKKMNIGDLSQFECFALMWNVFKWSSIISRFTKDYILKTCLKPMMWKGFERMRGFQKVLATANWNLNIGFGSSWMWLMVMMVKNFHQNWQSCSYMVIVYLMLMFILYLMLIFIVYLMLGAIKWCMHCVVNTCVCEQDISIDFCRVRGPHALMHSLSHTNIMPRNERNDRRCTNNIGKVLN